MKQMENYYINLKVTFLDVIFRLKVVIDFTIKNIIFLYYNSKYANNKKNYQTVI